MKNRNAINRRLVTWVQEKARLEYANDIDLIVMYGSYVNGTAGRLSDVDFYFVPRNERGYELAKTFRIDGVGYDLYPMSWERLEQIASLDNSMAPLIGDVEFLYCAGDAQLRRFEALQARLKENLRDTELTMRIAHARCQEAARLCARLDASLSESALRKTAGLVIMTLAEAIAAANQTYFHQGLKMQYHDLQTRFPALPGHIITNYRKVAEAADPQESTIHAKAMLDGVCQWLDISIQLPQESCPEESVTGPVDATLLAGLYEEISSTFNKIYACCETGNHILSYLSAVCLQNELDWARCAGCPAWGLLDGYNYRSLPRFAAHARDIESQLRHLILSSGGIIKEYADFDSFAAATG